MEELIKNLVIEFIEKFGNKKIKLIGFRKEMTVLEYIQSCYDECEEYPESIEKFKDIIRNSNDLSLAGWLLSELVAPENGTEFDYFLNLIYDTTSEYSKYFIEIDGRYFDIDENSCVEYVYTEKIIKVFKPK